jgi:hypothetical protein
MVTGVSRNVCWMLFVGLALLPSTVSADPIRIYESAELGPTGQTNLGFAIFEGQFVGLRFPVLTPTEITHIGGHFGGSGDDETIFGAIVRLSSSSDLPDSADLSTNDVLKATVLHLSRPSRDFTAPLSLTVEAGWYAVIFGSGLFGATGGGGFGTDNIVTNPINGFIQSGGILHPASYGSIGGRFGDPRVFVDGTPLTPVPEPGTLLLLGTGAAAILAGSRRRRSAR